jgi:hypothetical protein
MVGINFPAWASHAYYEMHGRYRINKCFVNFAWTDFDADTQDCMRSQLTAQYLEKINQI